MSNEKADIVDIQQKANTEIQNLQQKSYAIKQRKQLLVKIVLWMLASSIILTVLSTLDMFRSISNYILLINALLIVFVAAILFTGRIAKWEVKWVGLRDLAKELKTETDLFNAKTLPYNSDNAQAIFDYTFQRINAKAADL